MKRTLELIAGLIVLFFIGFVLWQMVSLSSDSGEPIACTAEAKLCPDGSAVSRSGPNCEFAPCPDDMQTEKLTGKAKEFKLALEEMVKLEIGQPIEGYEPAMFMQVLPGLELEDFDRVEAMIGYYEYENGELRHELGDVTMIHSAAPAVTDAGINTLFLNVTDRLKLDPEIVSVDKVIVTLKANNQSPEPGNIPPEKPLPPVPEPVACSADAKECPDGSYVGRVAPDCAFAECPLTDTEPVETGDSVMCPPEYEKGSACVDVYQPVCGLVEVQCITTPCNPVPETFSNSCYACTQPNVSSYTEGACVSE